MITAPLAQGYALTFAPPLVSFEPIDRALLNRCLVEWGHKMGPLTRPFAQLEHYHALLHRGVPVAVTASSSLIPATILDYDRAQAVELSRLCASNPALCRVALRLWREFVFPTLGKAIAVSYQDADLHTGNTYRFDGWARVAWAPAHGIDQRTGRPGRNKWIWVWPPPPPSGGAASGP